jgi:hypothetical protein
MAPKKRKKINPASSARRGRREIFVELIEPGRGTESPRERWPA